MPTGMNAYTPQQRPFYADDKELELLLIRHNSNPRRKLVNLMFPNLKKPNETKNEVAEVLKEENK